LSCSIGHALSYLLLEGRLAESKEKANNLVLLIKNFATTLLRFQQRKIINNEIYSSKENCVILKFERDSNQFIKISGDRGYQEKYWVF